jgi:hypothetical protein
MSASGLTLDIGCCSCRFGWTGDSALTADEASNNFDLSSFYANWVRDDTTIPMTHHTFLMTHYCFGG